MTELCEKHGPYSTICRACDLETIAERHAVPTPSAVEQVDIKVTPQMQAAWVAYEPYGQFAESMSFARFNGMMKHAFMSGHQAALAEAAGIAREIGRNPDWQSPIARETVRCAAEEIAEAILAAAGRS